MTVDSAPSVFAPATPTAAPWGHLMRMFPCTFALFSLLFVSTASMFAAGMAPSPLGANYTQKATTFSIWSPDTDDVKLLLGSDTVPKPMSHQPDNDDYSDVYSITVTGDLHLTKYRFLIHGKPVRDPYGVMVDPATGMNVVIDLSKTQPAGGWAPPPPLVNREDAILYELNVHDYTHDASSGVSVAKRGKFLGLVEHKTTIQKSPTQSFATGIDHLMALGVTHVQIMPFFDFRSCSSFTAPNPPNCYNWGYDPQNYNIPELNYSQSPNDPVGRITELKTMINEFHKSNIRVVMDVVYNHVPIPSGDDGLAAITPRYFLPNDISGAGQSLDGGVPMVSRMIRDSMEYWVSEYHVDGFRFDLMGVFRYLNVGDWAGYLNTKYPGRGLLIYGEPYAAQGADESGAFSGPLLEVDQVRPGTVAFIDPAHVGVFDIAYRDAIRGSDLNGGTSGGYMFNQGDATGAIQPGARGSIRFSNLPYFHLSNLFDSLFAARPEQSINFISVHDNLCLRDRIVAWAGQHGQSANTGYLTRIQEFGTGILLTSQGIPFLSEGDEFLRTKGGNSNSFNIEAPNIIDWNLRVANDDVFHYFQNAIALRRAHPALRMTTWEAVNRNIATSIPRSNDVIVDDIQGTPSGDPWSEILVIYNSGSNFDYPLPAGAWSVAMEKSAPVQTERVVTGTVTAEGTAVTVLHRRLK
jgi:pullulanase